MNTVQKNQVINIHDEPVTMFLENIGPKVKDLRNRRGMGQVELAKAAGVGQPLISRIENGTANPSLRTLIRLADALGVDVSEFTKGGDSDGQGDI